MPKASVKVNDAELRIIEVGMLPRAAVSHGKAAVAKLSGTHFARSPSEIGELAVK